MNDPQAKVATDTDTLKTADTECHAACSFALSLLASDPARSVSSIATAVTAAQNLAEARSALVDRLLAEGREIRRILNNLAIGR